MRNRPKWEDVFLAQAMLISTMSHDEETQHGCVITDRYNRILSQGCNGFPRKMKDEELPATRPTVNNPEEETKYDWMRHAERNALSNALIRPDNGIAYVSGQCCNDCIFDLWQEHVTKVYMADAFWGYNSKNTSVLCSPKAKRMFDRFVEQTGIEIVYINPVGAIQVMEERLANFKARLSQ